jgi:hypothetical protein
MVRFILGLHLDPCLRLQLVSVLPLINERIFASGEILESHLALYRTALAGGHKLVVVAHSQGNYYANAAFNQLDTERQINQNNFRIVSVATPADRVAGNGPYFTQEGDAITAVPGHLKANTKNSWSCGIFDINCHRFAPDPELTDDRSYLGGDVTLPQILNAILPANPWSLGAEMPTARLASTAGIAVVQGKITVVGHHDGNPGSGRVNEEYDPITLLWRQKTLHPRTDGRQALNWNAVVGNNIYFFGGANIFNTHHTQSVDAYNPVTDTWQLDVATYPLLVGNLATVAYNAQVYCFGGMPYNGAPYTNAYKFEPLTRTFTAIAPMPIGRAQARVFVKDNKIWVAGGYAFPYIVRATIDIYDPATNSWASGPGLPRADQHPYWVGTLNGELHALYSPFSVPTPVAYRYRLNTNTWEALIPSPLQQNGFGVAEVGGKLFLIGGGDPKVKLVQSFTP